jgi:hypothetical protein
MWLVRCNAKRSLWVDGATDVEKAADSLMPSEVDGGLSVFATENQAEAPRLAASFVLQKMSPQKTVYLLLSDGLASKAGQGSAESVDPELHPSLGERHWSILGLVERDARLALAKMILADGSCCHALTEKQVKEYAKEVAGTMTAEDRVRFIVNDRWREFLRESNLL